MTDLRLDGESFYYTFSATDEPADSNYFLVRVRSFISDGLLEGKEVQLDLDTMQDAEAEILELLMDSPSALFSDAGHPARISDVLSFGASYHPYTPGFAKSYPVRFEQGPDRSLQFVFPKTTAVDFADSVYNASVQYRDAADDAGLRLVPDDYIDRKIWRERKTLYIPTSLIVDEETQGLEDYEQWTPPVEEDDSDAPLPKKAVSNLTLNEQAILLFRAAKIMAVNKDRREKSRIYDRFACLDYRKNGKAEFANIANHVTSTTDLRDIFENLRPIHLAAMIPRVRLYKQYTPQQMKNRKDGSPREIIEYEFEEFPDADLLSSRLGTSTGVGIESFSWDFNGENQFASERQVSAKMELRAQSIDDLDRLRTSPGKVDQNGDPVKYRFTDIFYPPKKREQDRSAEQMKAGKNPRKEYEAKVVIEYGVDPKSGIWENDKKLLKAVQSLCLELNLSTSKYDMDLRSDGSILLTLDFVGRIDASSNDPLYANILPEAAMIRRLGEATSILMDRKSKLKYAAEIEGTIKLLRDAMDPIETQLEEARKNDNYSEQGRLSDELEVLRASSGGLRKELQELNSKFRPGMKEEDYLQLISREYDKIKLYQNIINGLFQRDAIDILQINPKDLLNEAQTVLVACEETVQSGAGGEAPTVKDVVNHSLSKSDFDRAKDSFIEKLKSSVTPLYSDERYYIKYFYFGDLLNVVLENMLQGSEDFKTDIRTLLGPIEIVSNMISSDSFSSQLAFGPDGKLRLSDSHGTRSVEAEEEILKKQQEQLAAVDRAHKSGNLDKLEEAIKDRQVSSTLLNLADVPISLNLFLSWFSEKVTNQGVYSYSLKKFIFDSVNSLIVSALQADSTKLILPKQKRKLVTTSFEANANIDGLDVFGFHQSPDRGLVVESETSSMLVEKYLSNKATKNALPLFVSRRRPKAKDGFAADYLLVYAESVDYLRKYRTQSDYQRDLDEGIYHLHSGREAGVVKEIKLTAETTSGYEEMKLIEAMKTGSPSTKRIYRADVTMNGIPIFRPGHKVFVEAAAYGSTNLLREFGLMGYYSVVTTSSVIRAGTYQTTLQLVYQGPG